jgi:hypothetical protein
LKENKNPNSKYIKVNKKENRVKKLLEHFDFTYEIRL